MSSLVRNATQRLLGLSGRRYDVSPEIPDVYLVGELMQRLSQLLRGLLQTRNWVFIGSRVRIRGLRQLKLSRGVSIGANTIIDARGNRGVSMASGSRLGRSGIITTTSHLSLLGTGVYLGKRSGIGDFFHIGASGGVTFGDDVIVGPYLLVHSQEHNYEDKSRPIREQGTSQAEVVVGDDCWIGSRVTLLAGTSLGPRTVVASGAVVRGHHPGNEILGGIPARPLKSI
jgi:acetyltransferase-like isoleucine patch superfamily enzyme